jgi:hypothetical protein
MSRIAAVILAGSLFTGLAVAAESRISSIPRAISDEGIYKVLILEIDSVAVEPRLTHHVDEGAHTITVQLLLDLEWTLDQDPQPVMTYRRDFQLGVQPGRHYQLAARIDVDATAEALSDGTFWSVFVYRETNL